MCCSNREKKSTSEFDKGTYEESAGPHEHDECQNEKQKPCSTAIPRMLPCSKEHLHNEIYPPAKYRVFTSDSF